MVGGFVAGGKLLFVAFKMAARFSAVWAPALGLLGTGCRGPSVGGTAPPYTETELCLLRLQIIVRYQRVLDLMLAARQRRML